MEDNQTRTIWQQTLYNGHASEALQLYRTSDNNDTAVEQALELFVDVQILLREKNVAKARQALLKRNKALSWSEQLSAELEPQLVTLEDATKALEKQEPEKTLTLLQSITAPLLLAEVETLRGTALIYHNDTATAKAAFEKALAHDPNHYRALTNLGNLALESSNTDEAIALYEQALKLNETFANAHHNLAVAYRKKGQVSKSVSELKKAQYVSQQKLRDDARQMFKGQSGKYLRWLMYAGAAIILFLLLRSRL
jgi:tetratricopeptide (TPR) repeat protein